MSKREKPQARMSVIQIQKQIRHFFLALIDLLTQLLFATGIEGGIHDRQVLKYQPSMFLHLRI